MLDQNLSLTGSDLELKLCYRFCLTSQPSKLASKLVFTQHPTRTVADPRVQTEIQVLLSTKAPYIKARDEEKARRPKLMSKYLAINRSV